LTLNEHLQQQTKFSNHFTMRFFTLAFSCLLFCSNLDAQVLINEYSAANMDGISDNYNEREDWIELYNAGSQPVSLDGYYLSDNVNNPGKWKFPGGVTIPPGGRRLVFASDRDEFTGGFLHAGFKLTQTQQEHIVLSDPQKNIIDMVEISKPNQVNHSRGRVTDGAAEWGIFTSPTPGAANASARKEYALKPDFSHQAGFYDAPFSLTLSAEPGLAIRYTTNGAEPTTNSPLYSSPIDVSQTTVVKARAYSTDPNVPASFVEANTYFIHETHSVPVLSISGSTLANLLAGNQAVQRGSFEYFDKGLLIDEAYGEYNRHGKDSWAYAQRGIDYITRDQMGYKSSIEHQIFPSKDRDNYQRLILKAAANDNYPFQNGAHIRDAYIHTLSQVADMELDERTYEPCVIYLNGKYWGLYEMREKVDDPDFTRHYYDQGEKWLDFIKTWGGTWEEYGSRAEWDDLTNFIFTNDMSQQANYEYVKERLEVLSLIDYMIINTHTVCKDWLNWNTAWWRGRKPDGGARKWRYALWDMDATFGHYINYTNIPNINPNADPCYNENLPADFEGHGELISALMQNKEFHSLYVNRYADMNNSFLSCEYMTALLDSLIDRITPEMPRQIERWGGNYAEWEGNVQEIRDFINARCIVIDTGIVDCYDVKGPYPVTVKIKPANSESNVRVNTFVPSAYPFKGDYFAGTTLTFQAEPHPDWKFDHWEVDSNSFTPNNLAATIQLDLADKGEVLTAVFKPLIPCANANSFVINSTLSSITLEWEGPTNFISYEFGYRKTGSGSNWNTFTTIQPKYTIPGLDVCSEYDVRVRTICDFAVGSYVEFTVKTACLNATAEAKGGVAEWSVFPNPFKEHFTVDFILTETTPVEIEVVNLTGQTLLRRQMGTLFPAQHRLAMETDEAWSQGLYFVRLKTEEDVFVKKLVKD
jgi:hypothetical protein